LFLAILFGIAVDVFLPTSLVQQSINRNIFALNSGAILYLLLATRMMFYSDHNKMLKRSELQDEGQFVILILALGAVATSLVAIVGLLSAAKELHGIFKYEHIALAALTIFTSWSFIHLIFALHYAHDYYLNLSKHKEGGLEFPGKTLPDYADFLYFSCVIGTSGQTADVSFSSHKMRRIGAIHCIFSFFFNTTILALTINIASGLF
jgi:uncharacterized membrane protein